jgi:ketosteroid isomerase-like protein
LVEQLNRPDRQDRHGHAIHSRGFARERIKATNKTFEDDWIFAITVRDGRLTSIREHIDTQALARASQTDSSGLA